MRGAIISYFDMCQKERASLQRGMNFRLHGRHSVLLMSVRRGAPYRDRVEDNGLTLIYEGHDVPKTPENPEPKRVDQPKHGPTGRLTENGKFHRAARDYKLGKKEPDLVRVYEKLYKGIWADNGYFNLVDAWPEQDDHRQVFKFKLVAIDDVDEDLAATGSINSQNARRRLIPSSVKQEVWKRDGGKCVICGRNDELHFDHIVPFSKGGTSLTAANVQLLCARHNLEKSAQIK